MRAVIPLSAGLVLLTATGADGGTLDLVQILREFGFPVFVTVWFMWRLEKRIDRFTESIERLITIVTVMAKTVDDLPAAPPELAASQSSRGIIGAG